MVSGISSLRVYIHDVNSIHKSERKTKYFPTITDAYGGFNDCVMMMMMIGDSEWWYAPLYKIIRESPSECTEYVYVYMDTTFLRRSNGICQ